MTKGRDNAAESLGDVLALIRSRRHSGLLSIERYESGRFEEGEIYFEKGKPVYARLGTLSNQEALAALLNWRQIYFLFSRDVAAPSTTNTTPNQPPSTSVTGPLSPSQSTGGMTPLPPTHSTGGMTPIPPSRPTTEPLQNLPANHNSDTTAIDKLIPRKLVNEQNVLGLPLTRPQRSLYMLVDGRRTIADLSRFTNRTLQEVVQLLKELKGYGLIIL